jgi:hypothetical protein
MRHALAPPRLCLQASDPEASLRAIALPKAIDLPINQPFAASPEKRGAVAVIAKTSEQNDD